MPATRVNAALSDLFFNLKEAGEAYDRHCQADCLQDYSGAHAALELVAREWLLQLERAMESVAPCLPHELATDFLERV